MDDELMDKETPAIVLKWNNTGGWGTCPICKDEYDPPVGMIAFLEGTWSPVCETCTATHAPIILAGQFKLGPEFYNLLGIAGNIEKTGVQNANL